MMRLCSASPPCRERLDGAKQCEPYHASPQAVSDAHATLWERRLDVPGAQFASEAVGLLQTVEDFKTWWAAQELPRVRPSLITLRLVSCAGDEPTTALLEARADSAAAEPLGFVHSHFGGPTARVPAE